MKGERSEIFIELLLGLKALYENNSEIVTIRAIGSRTTDSLRWH